jgi:hypothetical protein
VHALPLSGATAPRASSAPRPERSPFSPAHPRLAPRQRLVSSSGASAPRASTAPRPYPAPRTRLVPPRTPRLSGACTTHGYHAIFSGHTRTMRETSVIAPTAPCGRADPSAFYGDPDLPHLAAPSQASECHWHRSYHRDSSLTQAMALPSVPISEPTWLPNNIVRCGRSVLGGDGHRRTAHYIVSWCNGSQTCTPLPPSSPHGVDMRLVLPRRSLDVGVAQPLH